jgi:hypothetical protein
LESLKAIAEWMSEHLGWLCGAPVALLIGYILAWAFVMGPRRARQSLRALSSRGYTPVPADDPGLRQAIADTLPVYAHELLREEERSSATASFAVVRREARCTRYLVYAWRSYRLRPAHRTNTQETLVLEVMTTGLSRELEVSPFPEEAVRHGLTPVPGAFSRDRAGLLTVYARDPEGVRVPERLQDALIDVSPLLKDNLTKASAGIPRQVVGLRFTPGGWALSCNPLMTEPSELADLIRIADTIHAGLTAHDVA